MSGVLAGLAGLSLAVLPSMAAGDPPSTGSFTAVDDVWTGSGGGSSVTIAPGGTVTFGYPSGATAHNADFTSASPSSCTQTDGPSSGSVPPLPHDPSGPGWSGTCTFDTPGTYTFQCDLHPFMTGTVVVQGSATTTGTTTTPTTTATTTPGTTSGSPPSPGSTSPSPPPIGPTSSPLAGSPNQAVHVARIQHGATVRGTVKISPAGAGGDLQVTLLARGSAVGRRRSKLHPGTVRFSVALNGTGKRALRRRPALSVQVKILVRSPGGQTIRVTRRVSLRR